MSDAPHTTAVDHVVVFGLGIVGSLTALAILKHTTTTHVTIYEQRQAPATIGGALNLSPNAHRVMSNLGVSPKPYGGSTPLVLFQNEKGAKIGVFKYGGPGDKWANGFEGMRVVRNDIQDNLIEALKQYEISGRLTIIFGKKASSITEDTERGASITFTDGSKHENVDLVIGADGIHSFTRGQIQLLASQRVAESGPNNGASETTTTPNIHSSSSATPSSPSLFQPKATYSGVTTIYGLVPTTNIPQSVLSPLDAYHSIRIISPHAGLFSLSYATASRSHIHWFSSRTPPVPPSPDVAEPSPDAIREELLATYGSFKPELVGRVIKEPSDIYYWPVYRLDPMPDEWFSPGGRIVLVGDAAHAMPPHAAQGVGMGVEDAVIVAKVVKALSEQSSVKPSAALWRREYQSRRASRVEHFIEHAESQGRARMDNGWLKGKMREWGLWMAFPFINWVSNSSVSDVVGSFLEMVRVGAGGGEKRHNSALGDDVASDSEPSKGWARGWLEDVQGWGYDPGDEVISLQGLA